MSKETENLNKIENELNINLNDISLEQINFNEEYKTINESFQDDNNE
jgi:hypothetical protein